MRQIAIFAVYRCTNRFAPSYYSNQGEESAGGRAGFTRYCALYLTS